VQKENASIKKKGKCLYARGQWCFKGSDLRERKVLSRKDSEEKNVFRKKKRFCLKDLNARSWISGAQRRRGVLRGLGKGRQRKSSVRT